MCGKHYELLDLVVSLLQDSMYHTSKHNFGLERIRGGGSKVGMNV